LTRSTRSRTTSAAPNVPEIAPRRSAGGDDGGAAAARGADGSFLVFLVFVRLVILAVIIQLGIVIIRLRLVGGMRRQRRFLRPRMLGALQAEERHICLRRSTIYCVRQAEETQGGRHFYDRQQQRWHRHRDTNAKLAQLTISRCSIRRGPARG
jgi:hypothetical protein